MSFTGPMRRFWREASVTDAGEDCFGISLDDRPLRTPAKSEMRIPSRALAEGVAAEWAGQGETVDPLAMPLTRAVNTAIDRVATQHAAVATELAGYGGSDLLCYRAPYPAALAAKQAEAWDPLLDWAETALGARLVTGEGVMHVAQAAGALAALAGHVARHDPWALTALFDLVTISGSLVLGLAVSEGRLTAAEAWPLSRIDEDWQIAEWGEDAEAAARAAAHRADFERAERLLALLRAG